MWYYFLFFYIVKSQLVTFEYFLIKGTSTVRGDTPFWQQSVIVLLTSTYTLVHIHDARLFQCSYILYTYWEYLQFIEKRDKFEENRVRSGQLVRPWWGTTEQEDYVPSRSLPFSVLVNLPHLCNKEYFHIIYHCLVSGFHLLFSIIFGFHLLICFHFFKDPCYVAFHDEEWGVPVYDDKYVPITFTLGSV